MRYFFFATSALLPPALPQGNAGAAGFGGLFRFSGSAIAAHLPLGHSCSIHGICCVPVSTIAAYPLIAPLRRKRPTVWQVPEAEQWLALPEIQDIIAV
jgi:hypothetical protein